MVEYTGLIRDFLTAGGLSDAMNACDEDDTHWLLPRELPLHLQKFLGIEITKGLRGAKITTENLFR